MRSIIKCYLYNKIIKHKSVIFFSLVTSYSALLYAQYEIGNSIVSSNSSGSLILVGKKGNSYKDIIFKDKKGAIHEIFDDQYTYEDNGSKGLSPDKNFYVVTQNESGTAVSDSGGSQGYEVSSCAFIDTSNGCVVKKETGEYCGGTWSGDHGWPRLDGQVRPINSSLPSAAKLVGDYNNSIQSKKDIKSFVKYGATVGNVMSCDPVSQGNEDMYKEIANALDGSGHKKEAGEVNKVLQTLGK